MDLLADTQKATSAPPSSTSRLATFCRLPSIVAQRDLTSLGLRFALAVPFWRSGVNKWDGFLELSPVAPMLFENEFKLHVFGQVIDYPFPTAMAFMSGVGEIMLPILLVLGLFTRWAAFGLLAMTVIIQLTIPSGWPIHLTWAAMALAILIIGPARISIDRVLGFDR